MGIFEDDMNDLIPEDWIDRLWSIPKPIMAKKLRKWRNQRLRFMIPDEDSIVRFVREISDRNDISRVGVNGIFTGRVWKRPQKPSVRFPGYFLELRDVIIDWHAPSGYHWAPLLQNRRSNKRHYVNFEIETILGGRTRGVPDAY